MGDGARLGVHYESALLGLAVSGGAGVLLGGGIGAAVGEVAPDGGGLVTFFYSLLGMLIGYATLAPAGIAIGSWLPRSSHRGEERLAAAFGMTYGLAIVGLLVVLAPAIGGTNYSNVATAFAGPAVTTLFMPTAASLVQLTF